MTKFIEIAFSLTSYLSIQETMIRQIIWDYYNGLLLFFKNLKKKKNTFLYQVRKLTSLYMNLYEFICPTGRSIFFFGGVGSVRTVTMDHF